MAKKQGQIYIRDFQKSFYIGQTKDSSIENQYNRAAAHTAAACRVNIYGGKSEKGGARWKKASFLNSPAPEDKRIRNVGLKNTTYYTYDNLGVFQPIVDAFHNAGFYSNRNPDGVNTSEYDTLDIAEISLIYWYLNEGKALLNRDQGGSAGLRYHPEKSNWGEKLRNKLGVGDIKYSSSGGVNLGKKSVGKNESKDSITTEKNSLYNLLNNNNRPAEITEQIKDYIKAVVKQYIQQKVAEAYALAYIQRTKINLTKLNNILNENLVHNNDGSDFYIDDIINNSGDNLHFKSKGHILREIKNLRISGLKEGADNDSLIQIIQSKYNKSFWRNTDTFKKDFIKFLHAKGQRVKISYDFEPDLNGGSFSWDKNQIKTAIDNVVKSKKDAPTENSNDTKRMMVYGVCFAICYYIYKHTIDVEGPVLTVDGEEIAVRHKRGEWYSTLLQGKLAGLLPRWVVKNDAVWKDYYDAAMALYHATTHSSQMITSTREGQPTHRYYFSNLDLNSFNSTTFEFSSSKKLHTGEDRKASELEGGYKGNYYYRVNSGSIFEDFNKKNMEGAGYIWRRWKELYELSGEWI